MAAAPNVMANLVEEIISRSSFSRRILIMGTPSLRGNFSMDIIEIEGEPIAKKGKESGSKAVLRCENCGATIVVAEKLKGKANKICKCRSEYDSLLKPLIGDGHIKRKLHDAKHVRSYVLGQLVKYEL